VKNNQLLIGLLLSIFVCACSLSEADGKNKTGILTWKLNDGTLTISGKGPMPNYGSTGGPWCDLRNEYPYIIAIIIKDGVINIGNNAFVNIDTVVYVSIPDSVTSIGDNAFKSCDSIITITIPDSVINIDRSAFQDCSRLIAIDIPDGVLNIGKNAFMNCRSLIKVTLGKNVTFIGFDAFQNCKNIQIVTSNNSIPPHLETGERLIENDYTTRVVTGNRYNRKYLNVSAFDSVSKNCRLLIPDEYISVYKEDTQWVKFYNGRPEDVRIFKPEYKPVPVTQIEERMRELIESF
jgi:hypothetical protein